MQARPDIAEVMELALQTKDDKLWYALYQKIRAELFANADIDPDKPRRDARAAWRDMKFTDGPLSWQVCEDLQRNIETTRLMLRICGGGGMTLTTSGLWKMSSRSYMKRPRRERRCIESCLTRCSSQ